MLVQHYGDKSLFLAVSPLSSEILEKIVMTNDVFENVNIVLVTDTSFYFVAYFQLGYKEIKAFKLSNNKLKLSQGTLSFIHWS